VRGAFTSLAAADLDADGVPDFAGADRFTGNARIAVLDRSAAVRSEGDLPAGLLPSGAVVGRFDEGESPDLAVACSGSSQVAIFLNDGRGTFSEAGRPATIARPRCLAAGGLDGDACADLVVLSDGGLVLNYGLGGGTFGSPVAQPADQGGRYVDIAVAYAGGEGVMDLVALDAIGAAARSTDRDRRRWRHSWSRWNSRN